MLIHIQSILTHTENWESESVPHVDRIPLIQEAKAHQICFYSTQIFQSITCKSKDMISESCRALKKTPRKAPLK